MCAYGELKDQQFTNVAIIIGSEKEMIEPAEWCEVMGDGRCIFWQESKCLGFSVMWNGVGMLGWAKSHQFQDQNYKNNYNNCHLLSINGVLSALLRIYLCYFISSQSICAAGCARLSIVYLASSPPVVKCLLYRRREAETYISQNALPQMVPD